MELLPKLLQNQLVARVLTEPHKPPFPKWYDPNGRCEYHCDIQGHSTENCLPLKYKVQLLIKVGLLDFNRNSGPNVTANPLPNHSRPTINVITKKSGGESELIWTRLSRLWIRCIR